MAAAFVPAFLHHGHRFVGGASGTERSRRDSGIHQWRGPNWHRRRQPMAVFAEIRFEKRSQHLCDGLLFVPEGLHGCPAGCLRCAPALSGFCPSARDFDSASLRPCGMASHFLDLPLSRPSGHSPSLPSPERSPFAEWASDGGFFIFRFWYSYRGLEPRLQRAHAGPTQAASFNPSQPPCFDGLV